MADSGEHCHTLCTDLSDWKSIWEKSILHTLGSYTDIRDFIVMEARIAWMLMYPLATHLVTHLVTHPDTLCSAIISMCK